MAAALTEDQQRTWRAWLAVTRSMLEEIERRLSAEAPMPHSYYEILGLLAEAPGRTLRMGELATAAAFSRSRLSHALARMEGRGWVLRRSTPGRRATFAEITEEGRKVHVAATPGYLSAVRSVLFDAVTEPQAAALSAILDSLMTHLGPGSPAGGTRFCRGDAGLPQDASGP